MTVIDDLKAIAIEPDSIINILDEYPKFAMEINSYIKTRKQAVKNARKVEKAASDNRKLPHGMHWGSE